MTLDAGLSTAMQWLFWASSLTAVYAYAGYPLALIVLARLRRQPELPPAASDALPGISMIVPVHNERATIEAKIQNTKVLQYPREKLQVLFVSDGSTDGTVEAIESGREPWMELVVLQERGGKASALNAGLERARNEIVVFTDAAIELAPEALLEIVRPFQIASVGCVSGEDRIAQSGGEGLYGRYELFLRRQESRISSIVGASGSFYAQRRELCGRFPAGLAPDFLSVLRTVERGSRAISAPGATGTMMEVGSAGDEFRRKVRTVLRGITTLVRYAHLLNPFAYGWFTFLLLSHKVARWLIPFFLACVFVSSAVLATQSGLYALAFVAQCVLYALAVLGLTGHDSLSRSLPVKVSLYFVLVNAATVSAWLKYAAGARQELWAPSRR